MFIICKENYTSKLLTKYPDRIFLFGDNLVKKGTGGQAVIRYRNNSFGIPTKVAPCRQERCYFSDKFDEMKAVMLALTEIEKMHREGKTIVLPVHGIGTGLAELDTRAPKTFVIINNRIKEWTKCIK